MRDGKLLIGHGRCSGGFPVLMRFGKKDVAKAGAVPVDDGQQGGGEGIGNHGEEAQDAQNDQSRDRPVFFHQVHKKEREDNQYGCGQQKNAQKDGQGEEARQKGLPRFFHDQPKREED